MAREYTVTGDNQSLNAIGPPIPIVQLNPSAGGAGVPGFEVLRCWVSQRANATSAQQGMEYGTKVTAFSTVVGATPAKLKLADPAANLVSGTGGAGTAGINASAVGAGTFTQVYTDNFNSLNGWLWVATPAETVVFMPGGTSAFNLAFSSTPGTTTGWSWGVLYREVG
jgi:hypothetical protein